VWSVPDAPGDELRLAVILSRHGVRTPLGSDEAMAKYVPQPWPKWEVAPGIQTPRGNLLIALMGDYYRARFAGEGLLSGNPDTDRPLVFVRADNDQRTVATGRILGKGLVPGGEPEVHSMPQGADDPLFEPYRAHIGHPDTALAAASVLGRIGGDTRAIERAYAPQLSELKAIVFGPGAPGAPTAFDGPSGIVEGGPRFSVSMTGSLRAGWLCSEELLLEYLDGRPMPEVGWGRADGRSVEDLLALQALGFDLLDRTRYPAQVGGSNLASHIVDTLEQAALGQPVPGALGPPGERLVVLVGHDSNIANIGGLLGLNWWIPGGPANPVLPGGALVFELWERSGQPNALYVRTSYVCQTIEQMREATPLSTGNPPALSPIFVPGASGTGPDYDAPLDSFVRQARRAIDPSFVAEEP
jgi:4-phytase/acid phosphatase